MYKSLHEFSRRGNFIWYYIWSTNEYELQHCSIGVIMTVGSEFLSDYMHENGNVESALWELLGEYLVDYFSKNDGVGQRCILKKAFIV